MIYDLRITIGDSKRAPARRSRGKRFTEVVMLMQRKGGVVRASDLSQEFGLSHDASRSYLHSMAAKGRLARLPAGALCLKPGKWEPAYQLNLNLK